MDEQHVSRVILVIFRACWPGGDTKRPHNYRAAHGHPADNRIKLVRYPQSVTHSRTDHPMNISETFAQLAGAWTGTNQLWLMPGEPVHTSSTHLTVRQGARGGFTALQYTWEDGGEAQEGLLALGPLTDEQSIQASWIDTFHTMGGFMAFAGAVVADGRLVLKGSYSLPGTPVWGWQIRIAPPSGDQFQLTMYNISPEGEEYLAVEATYTRTGA